MEVWQVIDEFSNYSVSNKGRVQNLQTGYIFKSGINAYGYPAVSLVGDNGRKKTFSVHTLVADAFVEGYRPGMQVDHVDGNKYNNYAENLEWVTPQQNIERAWQTGLKSSKRPGIVIEETGQTFKTQIECASYFDTTPERIGRLLARHGRLLIDGVHISYAQQH